MSMEQFTIRGFEAGWGANFIRINDQLIWCDENNILPYIKLGPETRCFYNGTTENIWELFYNQLSPDLGTSCQVSATPSTYIECYFGNALCTSYENRKKVENTYLKYFKPNLKEYLNNKIVDFMSEKGLVPGKYFALHIRGTDWLDQLRMNILRSILFPLDRYYSIIKEIIPEDKKLFVMSDNWETIYYMEKKFKDVVFYKDAIRAENYSDPNAPHNTYTHCDPKMIEDLILEATVASQSEKFIHSEGNTDLMVLLMNATLNSHYIKTIKTIYEP
jgi:hypothetical protein